MRKLFSAVLVILAALAVCSAPAADFTGDGQDDIAVFRPSAGLWAIRGYTRAYFGTAGDIPTPGRWTQGARDQIAIFRPSTGLWAVQGGARNYFGTAGDIPLGFGGGSDWVRNGNKIYYNQGSVGIGTTNPFYRLHLHTRDSGHSYLQFTNTGTGPGHLDGVLVGLDPAEDFRIHSYENNNIRFHIDDVERMRIAANGNVGIGTSNPQAKLHVHSTALSPALIIRGGSNTPPNQWLARFYDAAGTEQFRFAGSGWGFASGNWGTFSPYVSMHFIPEERGIAEYEVGDLISALEGRAVKTSGAFDRTVVGVICPPEGFISIPVELRDEIMGDEKPIEDYPLVPVAYLGNVQVKVNSEGGEIKSGDLIVPSSTPGVGMRGEPETFPQYAAVIGKAREGFTGSEGLIRVSLGVK